MSFAIESGVGNGTKAKVNSENKLETESITIPEVAHRASEERAFILSSGFVALTTTGSFNALLYVKNTSTRPLHIQSVRTCHTNTGSSQIQIFKDVTTGTIVSDANAGFAVNSNSESNTAFTGLLYSASGDGKTVTDGSHLTQFINGSPGHSTQTYGGGIIVGQGSSITLELKPTAAGTACVEIVCYYGDA